MAILLRNVTIEDYDLIYQLWISTEQSKRALNPVDDSREGIEKYLKRNPNTCFLAYDEIEPDKVAGVILTGHDGRRGFIHHTCVSESCRGQGIGTALLNRCLEALKAEGIHKVALLVFRRLLLRRRGL